MEMFKFSEFDLEWTTTKSTIKFYTSLDSSLDRIFRLIALHRHLGNTALDSFVLIDSIDYHNDFSKLLFTIYALISCVNTIHKTCHRVVKISNSSGNRKCE